MSLTQNNIRATAEMAHAQPSVGLRTEQSLFQCLIVSASSQRCGTLTRAAADGRWSVQAYTDARKALVQSKRTHFHLAMIDFQACDKQQAIFYRKVCENLAETKELLLVVCGKNDDPMEEIWARQIGSWFYLPGIDDNASLGHLCGQAMNVAVQATVPEYSGHNVG